jgi:hypothetical protein
MYVDESGDTGLRRSGSPTRYFALSGIVVHESRWRDFLEALIAFGKVLRNVYGLACAGRNTRFPLYQSQASKSAASYSIGNIAQQHR